MPVNDTFARVARKAVVPAVLALVALPAACGGGSPDRGTPPPAEPPIATVAPATPGPTATLPPLYPQSTELMNAMFTLGASGSDFFDAASVPAIKLAGRSGDRGLVPPLIDVSRFTFTTESIDAIGEALTALTGEKLGSEFETWYEWHGRHPDHPVVDGYDEWKGEMLSSIDPRFERFFYKGVPARVPLWGAVWGGVRVDGIPPIDDPAFIAGLDASYLQPDDIVLGVEINGDVRAYPHRILAWHEMSNDVVGGKPVTLVY